MDNTQQQILMGIAEKLGSVASKVDDLHRELKGNGQPGFIEKTNSRLSVLETHDDRRMWATHSIWAVITISATLLKDKLWHH